MPAIPVFTCARDPQPTARGDHSPVPEPPSAAAVPELLRDLEGVDPTVVAFACLEWAARGEDAKARLALVVAMVERLAQLSPENLRDVAAVLLGNADLLSTVADALPIATAGRVTALEAVTAALGNATSGTLDDHRWGELAKCASSLAEVFLAKHGFNYDDALGHLQEVLDLASARAEIATVSPFRRHAEWRRATCKLAFGQIVLLNLRARSREDVDVEVGPLWSLVAEASPALHAALLSAVREL